MAADRRLLRLQEALRRCPAQPANRIVTMVARVTTAAGVGLRDLPALDPGAGIAGGTVLPTWIDTGALEIVTWNTGEASDLRRYGNRSHAEAQFYEFMRDRDFTSIEIEISHSPCTACADMLAGLLRSMRDRASSVLRGPSRRVGKSVLVGSATDTARPIPATLRWGALFETPPQGTTPQSLRALQAAGWRLVAPRSAIPNDAGTPAITLL